MASDHRTVLAPSVAREQFQDLALSAGWRPHAVADQEGAPYEEVWSVDDDTSSVHYVEDDLLGVASVRTMGDRAAELAEHVARHLPSLTRDEILVWAYVVEDAGERRRAIGYVAAIAPNEPLDAVAAVLESALDDPHPEVRDAALFACAHLSWPTLLPLVEAVRDNDPEESVRANAARVLEMMNRP